MSNERIDFENIDHDAFYKEWYVVSNIPKSSGLPTTILDPFPHLNEPLRFVSEDGSIYNGSITLEDQGRYEFKEFAHPVSPYQRTEPATFCTSEIIAYQYLDEKGEVVLKVFTK